MVYSLFYDGSSSLRCLQEYQTITPLLKTNGPFQHTKQLNKTFVLHNILQCQNLYLDALNHSNLDIYEALHTDVTESLLSVGQGESLTSTPISSAMDQVPCDYVTRSLCRQPHYTKLTGESFSVISLPPFCTDWKPWGEMIKMLNVLLV